MKGFNIAILAIVLTVAGGFDPWDYAFCAEPAGEVVELVNVPGTQLVTLTRNEPVFAAIPDDSPKPQEVIVKVQTAPDAAAVATATAEPAWLSFAKSPMGTAIISAVLGFVLLKTHHGGIETIRDTASRWESVVLHCFNDAERQGLLNGIKGHDKLAIAMNSFDTVFQNVFGKPPTAQDRADARVDFGKVAFNADATPFIAPPAAARGVAGLVQPTA